MISSFAVELMSILFVSCVGLFPVRFPRLLIVMSDLLISFAGLAVLLVMAGVSRAAVWCALSVSSMMRWRCLDEVIHARCMLQN